MCRQWPYTAPTVAVNPAGLSTSRRRHIVYISPLSTPSTAQGEVVVPWPWGSILSASLTTHPTSRRWFLAWLLYMKLIISNGFSPTTVASYVNVVEPQYLTLIYTFVCSATIRQSSNATYLIFYNLFLTCSKPFMSQLCFMIVIVIIIYYLLRFEQWEILHAPWWR